MLNMFLFKFFFLYSDIVVSTVVWNILLSVFGLKLIYRFKVGVAISPYFTYTRIIKFKSYV